MVTRSVISRAINVGNVNAVKNTFIGIKNQNLFVVKNGLMSCSSVDIN